MEESQNSKCDAADCTTFTARMQLPNPLTPFYTAPDPVPGNGSFHNQDRNIISHRDVQKVHFPEVILDLVQLTTGSVTPTSCDGNKNSRNNTLKGGKIYFNSQGFLFAFLGQKHTFEL